MDHDAHNPREVGLREIDFRKGGILERELPHASDDADNLPYVTLEMQLLSDRILVPKELPSQRVVDKEDLWSLLRVVPWRQEAAAQQRYPERLEVVPGYGIECGAGVVPGLRSVLPAYQVA